MPCGRLACIVGSGSQAVMSVTEQLSPFFPLYALAQLLIALHSTPSLPAHRVWVAIFFFLVFASFF